MSLAGVRSCFTVGAVKTFFVLSILFSSLYFSQVLAGSGPPPPPPKVATPTFSPNGGSHNYTVDFTISTTTASATLYYTTDGSIPTTSSTQYTGPVTVTTNSTVKALGIRSGYTNSSVGSSTFTVLHDLATPDINPSGGSYTDSVDVTITESEPGSTIYYTTDGSDPTTSSTQYSAPFTLTSSATIKSFATHSNYLDSSIAYSSISVTSSGGGSGGGGPVAGDLVSTLPGEFSVSNTGAATYSIPVMVSPGTAGLAPQLSLNYSSQSRNGSLGLNWALGGLSILHRCPTSLVKDGFIDGIDFDDNDRFCLDGQPLIAINGTYGASGTEYRTEIDSFSKIISYGSTGNGPTHFKVWTKSGEIMEYGNTADTMINPPLVDGTPQPDAFCWYLNKVSDTVGNYMTLTYFENETTGEHYVEQIDYTGNVGEGLSPYNSVEFSYEARNDTSFRYVYGLQIESTKRLASIASKSNGSTVADYQITYAESVSTGRSQIETITQCDVNNDCVPYTSFNWQDEANPTLESTPALTPPYPLDTWNSDSGAGTVGFYGTAAELVDLNGDGLTDLAYHAGSYNYSVAQGAYINTGTDWQSAPQFIPPVPNTDNFGKTARFVDLNGDGLVDYLAHNNIWGGGIHSGAWLNTGSGWQSTPAYSPPLMLAYNSSLGSYTGAEFVDLNGDGLLDLSYSYDAAWTSGSPGAASMAYLNTGTGWQAASNYAPPHRLAVFTSGYVYQTTGSAYIDLNGDGLPDFVYAVKSGSTTTANSYLNTGSGWALDASYALPKHLALLSGGYHQSSGATFADFNGDGLQDFAYSVFNGSTNDEDVWLNTGKGWRQDNRFVPPFHLGRSYNGGLSASGAQFIDLNSDGLSDFAYSIYPGDAANRGAWLNTGSGWQSMPDLAPQDYLGRWYNNSYTNRSSQYADLDGNGTLDFIYNGGANLNTGKMEYVDNITNGFSVGIDIIEASIVNNTNVYQNNACISSACFPARDYIGAMNVVKETRTDNGIGSENILTYKYEDAQVHAQGRGFLGFGKRTVTDVDTNVVVETNFMQDFPYVGQIESASTTANGVLAVEENNTFGVMGTPGADPVFPYVSSSVSNTYDYDSSTLLTTINTTSTYDSYGCPTDTMVSTNDVGIDTYVTTTDNTYTNDESKWHLCRLTQATVTKTGGAQASPARTSTFGYNSTTGLLNMETIEPGPDALIKTYAHDGFGNRISVTESGAGITSRTTQTTYDAKGQYPISITNALGHTETRGNYDAFGNARLLTGPNNLSTTWEFDSQGRKIREVRADTTESNISYVFCTGGTTCPSQVSGLALYKIISTSTGSATSITYLDAVNRVILSEAQSFDGTSVFTQTEYDSQGRVDRASNPYFGTGTTYWTEYTFDDLGRVIQQNSPTSGATTISYNSFVESATNALNQTSTEQTNSLGQTIWTEDSGGNQLDFEYDSQGNVITVTDSANNVTTNTYDTRGFKTQMVDPDMGTWSYNYNVLGELASQTDAKNQTVSMTYDKLGRLITRSEDEGSTTWSYDTATKGVGKLASVSHYGGYSRSHSYDSLGRPDSTTTVIGGTSYTTSTSYDAFGRVDDVTYPGGSNFKVENQYNAFGYLEQVRNANNTSEVFYTANYADEFGNIEMETYGNSVVTMRNFHDNSGRLEYIKGNLGAVQNLEYTFNNIGNLTQRKDVTQSLTEDFTYDNLNRLTQATVAGAGSVNFTYDNLGNITYKSDVGNYIYGAGSAGPHAVTSTTGVLNNTYTYDANGNQITGDGKTLTWSSYNKPTAITKAGNSSNFTYGPGRARYLQVTTENSASTITTYIGGLYEKVETSSDTQEKHFIRAGGNVIAIFTNRTVGNDETQYLHRDHLGSVDTITDSSGAIVEKLSFDAFGKRRLSSWNNGLPTVLSNNTRGFTGHEMLDAVGLIHMNGRVYDPLLGRFMSADPTLQHPKDMQNYNRYSYVHNNPLSLTDPSGFGFLKKLKKAFKSISRAIRSVGRAIRSAVKSILNAISSVPILNAIAQGLACFYGGPWGCAAYAAATTYAATGDIGLSLQAGAFAYATAAITQSPNLSFGQKAIAQGVVGGIQNRSQGRSFSKGFAGSAFGATFGGGNNIIRSAIVAGTSSVISGGKFKNGVTSVAGGYLYSVGAGLVGSGTSAEQYDPSTESSNSVPPAGTEDQFKFLEDSGVKAELDKAWQDSNPNAPEVHEGLEGSLKVEQGGWIVKNKSTGKYKVIRFKPGTRDSINVGGKPRFFYKTEGWFHTHPNTTSEGYDINPSPADISATNKFKVPGVVLTPKGNRYIPYRNP